MLNLFGSKVGAVANARISPVVGSINTAVIDCARVFFATLAIAFSVIHCKSLSIVRRIFVPAFAGISDCLAEGIEGPFPLE